MQTYFCAGKAKARGKVRTNVTRPESMVSENQLPAADEYLISYTNDRNPPYTIRDASNISLEFVMSGLIRSVILGSDATFSFARSRASREANTTHPKITVSSSLIFTTSAKARVPSKFESSATYSKYSSAPYSFHICATFWATSPYVLR